ncbi:MAG: hypothetical protein ACE5HQ_13105 [Gemmatimonadota bacterium]
MRQPRDAVHVARGPAALGAARGRAALCLALVGLVLAPRTASAQEVAPRGPFSLSARVGLANPTGDLGQLHSSGFFAAVGVGYRILPRVDLRAELGRENLERNGRPSQLGGIRGPQADLYHVTAMLEFELTDPNTSGWEVSLGVGGGDTRFEVQQDANFDAISGYWPTLQSALQVGYEFAGRTELFARIDGYLMLGDAQDPRDYLGKEISVINGLGLRVRC